jgi:anti-sigma regulatory factor (Ser/Thr protein kinase)
MPHPGNNVRETRHFKFRSRPEAVSAARRALDGFEQMLELSVFYDASLCVSELVTNAVLHADMGPDDELELDVEISDATLNVAVTDLGSGFEPLPPTPGDESGFGLYIVDRLSDRWGVDRDDRTRVWFEMALRTEAAAETPPEAAEEEERPAQTRRRPFTGRRVLARSLRLGAD